MNRVATDLPAHLKLILTPIAEVLLKRRRFSPARIYAAGGLRDRDRHAECAGGEATGAASPTSTPIHPRASRFRSAAPRHCDRGAPHTPADRAVTNSLETILGRPPRSLS